MSINLNGNIAHKGSNLLEQWSRGFYFGDGLFESIRMFDGFVPFLHLHWARLETGMRMLGFDVPENWSFDFFEKEIIKIARVNARVKITVWRSPGGLFFPTDNSPNFMVTSTPLTSNNFNWYGDGLHLALCTSVQLPIDTLSGLKTLGGTRYVLAAIEARAKGVDDVILLNAHGHVCETSSGSLFWIKDDIVYMPSPKDGQVLGTFQNVVVHLLQSEGIQMVSKSTTFAELMAADEVFLTNAIHGIRPVRFLEGTEFRSTKTITFFNLTVALINAVLFKKMR
jgi:branched-chain amino acid aminotransferase